MNKLRLVVASLAVLAVMSVSSAGAEKQISEGIAKDATQDRVQDVFGRGEMQETLVVRSDQKFRERVQDTMDQEHSYRASGRIYFDYDAGDYKATRGRDNSATRGNERARQMRVRRYYRAAIKDEHKAGSKVGEGKPGAEIDALETMTDEESESSGKKEKKAWWKFWD